MMRTADHDDAGLLGPPAPRRGRGALLTLALVSPITLALACGASPDPAAERDASRSPVTATLAEASRTEAPQGVELLGTVEAEQVAAISTRVMATVTALYVRPGERVDRGQTLLTIDPQAAQGEVARARGGLTQAEAALSLAERNHQRFLALAAQDAASPLELDRALLELEQARGAVEQARGALSSASSVAADSRVVAPFPGRVVSRLVEVGDLAAPGRPLLTLESEGPRLLSLSVPESVMARRPLEVGQGVPVRIDSRPDLGELAGVVVEATPGSDPMARSFQVKVLLPAADLPSGVAGRAWVETGRRQAVAIPAEAVIRQGGLELVVLATADRRTISRVVTVGGALTGGQVEILSGLQGGETVLVGLQALPPGGSPVQEVR
jgi:RND family efflux transporter MFP subunit